MKITFFKYYNLYLIKNVLRNLREGEVIKAKTFWALAVCRTIFLSTKRLQLCHKNFKNQQLEKTLKDSLGKEKNMNKKSSE